MATRNTDMAITEAEPARVKNQRRMQYFAAFIATIGGFIMGTTLGWASPAGSMIIENPSAFGVKKEDLGWIVACMPLGAMFGCPFTAYLVDKFGRKNMMMMMTMPVIIGWAMIMWVGSVSGFCGGRLLTGFASGSFSVIVPLYTSEIAEKEIRGTLGTYFQLQVTAGILFTYVLGYFFNSVFALTVCCAIVPIAYLGMMAFTPESPNFHLMTGNVEAARISLRYFRGLNGTVELELTTMQNSLAKAARERVPMLDAFRTTAVKRGLFVGLGVMILQQFTGCNAVIFFSTEIFKGADINDPALATIIVGVMSVIATYISTLIIDKVGRQILLLTSIIIMGFCTFFLGTFFWLKEARVDVTPIGFIPLFSLCLFIVLFSVGFGPIPWMLMGEIFPAQIKGTASSIVCVTNWFYAFLVTKFFQSMVDTIYIHNTFWVFSSFCVLGTFFVLLFVPETKGKTMDEIQQMLGAKLDILPTNINRHYSVRRPSNAGTYTRRVRF